MASVTVRSSIRSSRGVCVCSPHPPLHGHGADVPPSAVEAARRLLDGVVLRVAATGVGVVEQNVTERENRRHAVCVLLDVPLETLQVRRTHALSHTVCSFFSIEQTK